MNLSKPVLPIDVHKSVHPVNSSKPVYPVDVCKSVCPDDICKPFFVDFWRHVVFCVSVNTSVFYRITAYLIIFIYIHMTYLIFTKFFMGTYIILIDYYFLLITGKFFTFSFFGMLIICKHFLNYCKLYLQ